ncbi:MAG: UvrD-helicase domain-containing protein [Methylophilaceae bacterium]
MTMRTDDLKAQDSANRERALERNSFIVEAPAGAGKTELLTQRYLRLLASVSEPEEIIALTFTNKAAAEMRNRILLSLEHAEQKTPETAPHKLVTRELANVALEQSTALGWNIINQPSRLRILTIDALCSSLTRQMPLLSKFGGQPKVSDDTETIYLEAARRTIADIANESKVDDPVTSALRYLDNNSEKLIQLLAKMLARRDQWLPLASQLHSLEANVVAGNIELALEHLINEALQAVLDVFPTTLQQALMPLARYAASNLDSNAEIAPLLDWQIDLKAHIDDLTQWQALSSFLVTKNERSYRKTVNKNNGFLAEHKDKKEDYFAVIERLEASHFIANVIELPSLKAMHADQPVIQALTKLLMLAATHLWAVFQESGEVDFVAIAQSAQLALEDEQGVTDLALKLDYKITHLLIDEFQDTSPVQMRLIEKLIEGWEPEDGRTLFCVGDPMQSIYRFRKADVSLFLQAAEQGIGHLPLTRLQLSRNNRSFPAVVKWVNDAFLQIFPSVDNINQGAISYRKFIATHPPVDGEGVTVHPLVIDTHSDEDVDDNSVNSKLIEAHYVADLIVRLRAGQPKAKKIAVLVRSRSHLQELVSEIRRNHAHLKFQALEIEHLDDRQTVQDAFSLTCALMHRADRAHWLNILRAPWCGLTLSDLHALSADNHRATIWQLMHESERIQTLSAEGQLRLMHVTKVLTAAFEHQGRMPTRRWLESTWLQLGGGKCLIEAGDNRDVQVFFDLVEKVGRNGSLDIAALEMAMQKLYAKPDIEADESLQFLTIHKSKGLQFDTVILPALNRPPRNSDHELVLWQEVTINHHLHLIAAPLTMAKSSRTKSNTAPSVYDFLKGLETQRSDNEIVRLLYVAATRAERCLHLIASIQTNAKGEIKPKAKSLLQVLWPAVEEDFKLVTPLGNQAVKPLIDFSQFKSQLQRLPVLELSHIGSTEFAGSAIPFDSADNTNPVLENLSEYLQGFDLQRHCGTLAHLYMQLLTNADFQSWNEVRLQQCLPAMVNWLQQQGHTLTIAKQGATQVLAALQATLASAAGQWLLKDHNDAVSELSLMQSQTGSIKNHVIDRTFIENGTRWIVDYKLTTQNEIGDPVTVAEQHRPQLSRYASLFVQEKLPIKIAVFFLSLAKLVEL